VGHEGLHVWEGLETPACERVAHGSCGLPGRLRRLPDLRDLAGRAGRCMPFLFHCDVHECLPFPLMQQVYNRPLADSTAKAKILVRNLKNVAK
jgi:hypothetical protein